MTRKNDPYMALPDLDSSQDWRLESKCRDVRDPDIFFPDRGEPIGPAISICRRCPVSLQCFEYALVSKQECGIWGGEVFGYRR